MFGLVGCHFISLHPYSLSFGRCAIPLQCDHGAKVDASFTSSALDFSLDSEIAFLQAVMEIKGNQWQGRKCEETIIQQHFWISSIQPKSKMPRLQNRRQKVQQAGNDSEDYSVTSTLESCLRKKATRNWRD